MRGRPVLVLLLAALAVLGAGCGGGDEASPTVETVVETQGEAVTEDATTDGATTGEGEVQGDPEAGVEVFASAGCGGCHVLEAAGTTGAVGPSLDDTAPSYDKIVERVTNGKGAMPSFKDQLSEQQIQDVAAYVFEATH